MKIRMPTDIWTDIGTPANPIRLRMPDGTWEVFGGGGGAPLYLRNPSGVWIQVTTAGIGNVYTLYFSAIDRTGENPFRESTGWAAQRRFYYEYKLQNGNDDSNGRPLGEQLIGTATGSFGSIANSEMGGLNNEINTWFRYSDRQVGWYSLPIGMFITAAEVTRTLYEINRPGSWAATAEPAGTEVDARLSGYSVIKKVLPGNSLFNEASTTTGLNVGVGQVLAQGMTPGTYLETYNYRHTDYLHNDAGVITNPTPRESSIEAYTLPVIRIKPYVLSETGTSVWTGDLNSLGVRSSIHGIPATSDHIISRLYTSANYMPQDSLQYHARVAPLADPPPIDFVQEYCAVNYLDVSFNVRVKYRF